MPMMQTGCVTKNPDYSATSAVVPGAPVIPAYIPDLTKLSNAIATAQSINGATAAINPYSGLVGTGLTWTLGIATAISTIVAGYKSKQATAHATAADSLAQTIVATGKPAVDKALSQAADNGALLVAAHINNNTTV